MRQEKHPHKFMICSEVAKFLLNKIVPFIISLLAMGSIGVKFPQKYGGNYTVVSVVSAVVLVDIILAIVKWKKNVYSLVDDVISIKYGALMTHERSVPFSQVQSEDISSSVIQRLFDVYKLEIDTARGEERFEISLLLSKQEAIRVKNIIFKGNENNGVVEVTEGRKIKKTNCSLKDLFVMATMSSHILLGFFIIIGVYLKIEDIAPEGYMRKAKVFGVATIKAANATRTIKYRVALVFIVLFISWAVSVLATIIKYYKFTVIREEDNIKLSHGLFDKKEVDIPVKQIQSTTIVEGVTGYFSLKVDTIGNGEDRGGNRLICPSAKMKELNKIFKDILPEMNITYDLIKPPRKALIGFLLCKLIIYFIFMSLITIYVPYGYFVFLLLPILTYCHYMSFNDNGTYWGNDFVVMRYRKFSRKTVIIKRNCIKSIDREQNYFQKRQGITKYKVTIVGENSSKSYSALQ